LKSMGSIYASFILVLIVTALLLTSYEVVDNSLAKTNNAIEWNIRKLEAITKKPSLDLAYINNTLYLVIQPTKPVNVDYLFIDYMNGTIKFYKMDKYISKIAFLKIPISSYLVPFKVGVIIDHDIALYYNPMSDPWLLGKGIFPNTTYIDQNLIEALEENSVVQVSSISNYSPIFLSEITTITQYKPALTLTRINFQQKPLEIKLKITGITSPQYTLYSPVNAIQTGSTNTVKRIASLEIAGHTINIYGLIYRKNNQSPAYIVLLINSSTSSDIVFKGTIKVAQSMSPLLVRLGDVFVSLNEKQLDTPLALSPYSNTSISLSIKQYVQNLPNGTDGDFIDIDGSAYGHIVSDGIIVLGYMYYVTDSISINVDLNISMIEFINIEPAPITINIDSNYFAARLWGINVSIKGSDPYAEGLYYILEKLGLYTSKPLLIFDYGGQTITRIITTTSPVYVKTNSTIIVKPGVPKWLIPWHSWLTIQIIPVNYPFPYYVVYKGTGRITPTNSPGYIASLLNTILLKEYPSGKTIIILIPNYVSTVAINSGEEWKILTSIIYRGTEVTINNPLEKTLILSVLPLNITNPQNPLTLYYTPRLLGTPTNDYFLLQPGKTIIKISLSPGYYLLIPLTPDSEPSMLDPIIIRVI